MVCVLRGGAVSKWRLGTHRHRGGEDRQESALGGYDSRFDTIPEGEKGDPLTPH